MTHFLLQLLQEFWSVLKESAPFVLFGFFAAGLLKGLLPAGSVFRHLGGRGVGPVLRAAIYGIPLPLCSCGVVPAAMELRRQGASRGATAAFLISVPETGIDSVAITWALLDPLMTLLRPVAAFVTAALTGLAVSLLPGTEPGEGRPVEPDPGCG